MFRAGAFWVSQNSYQQQLFADFKLKSTRLVKIRKEIFLGLSSKNNFLVCLKFRITRDRWLSENK